MANDEHLETLLHEGVDAWNAWRRENPDIDPDLDKADLAQADLSGADLRKAHLYAADLSKADLWKADLREAELTNADLWKADLREADLSAASLWKADLGGANLSNAHLSGAYLIEADLSGANLSGADFGGADLSGARLDNADLSAANLSGAKLFGANLSRAHLSRANFSGAVLRAAILVQSDLTETDLTGCSVYGISAWGLKLDGTKQQNLIITHSEEPTVTVDNIEVAQFIYLMLHNQKIRDVIDTITSKAVLILGRFTHERKAVLDALREELRKRDYLPILFDFEKPRSRDTDETITLLARMARFVIADITDAKSVLQELRAIVPDLPSVPIKSIILATQEEPGMFDFYRNRSSFLTVHRYADQEQLLADLGDKVIRPAELKVREFRG
ncbi:MAG: pentapeptide repeat-containing protein [Xanthobacteraceae bacterium]|nr:pentapeptide repeat-containing protein [Xanthobacteraceae bacterium]